MIPFTIELDILQVYKAESHIFPYYYAKIKADSYDSLAIEKKHWFCIML